MSSSVLAAYTNFSVDSQSSAPIDPDPSMANIKSNGLTLTHPESGTVDGDTVGDGVFDGDGERVIVAESLGQLPAPK
jgi:hypothetical protein